LCALQISLFSEVLYLEFIFKSFNIIYYLLLHVKKFIMLSRFMHRVVLYIAFVTSLWDSCPEMDQWLRFKPWTQFILIHSFWAVN